VPEKKARIHDHRSKFRAGQLGVLAEPGFRLFCAGYATSLLGSAMATIALTFAVLRSGGTPDGLGLVFSAAVVPQVLFMLGGGVLADRIGRRPVMLVSDGGRLAVQACLATALFLGRPPIWLFVVLAALLATGDAFFAPALGRLTPELVPAVRLADANALLSVAQSAAKIAGPALAGILIAVTGPATVIAVDAGTFGLSLSALALLRVPAIRPVARSPWRDLADGWAQFRAQAWLLVTTVQYAVVGPVAAVVGAGALLGAAAVYATLSSAAVLTVPAIWSVTWPEPAGPDGPEPAPPRRGDLGPSRHRAAARPQEGGSG
jgi:MFS family permease